uniref:HMG box domain-containing protein n=1 Tax=Graphocephala atropunctata TaxID=36148 RepID=A0A1B6MU69_9HEMI
MAASTSPQQFNLRWNNHTNNIIQVFAEQLTSENLVDVTISCEGQFLKAHKMVLSACSPYFQELFRIHQVPHPVIIINGMSFLDIKLVIEFMYRGEVKVQEGDLGGLLVAAETLQVKGLSNVRNKYEKGQIPGVDDLNLDRPNQHDMKKQLARTVRNFMAGDQLSEQKDSELQSQGVSSPSTRQDMDDDLPATIKVEPPDIRDIDEEEPTASGWDSPRLIIDMKESKETMTDLKRIEALDRKRPNILRQPIQSIRVASAHLELSDDETNTPIKEENKEISSSAKCFLWPKRPKLLATWGRTKVCKIPRPPNAFMIFANDFRRKLALKYPVESNKDISVRLGSMWKNLDPDSKEMYYSAARKADEEHKQKYPGYYYSPKEARIRKGLKRRIVAAQPQVDALRFVKVFMTSSEKNSLLSKDTTSLLRKLQPKPDTDQTVENSSEGLTEIPTVVTDTTENGDVQNKDENIKVVDNL